MDFIGTIEAAVGTTSARAQKSCEQRAFLASHGGTDA